MNEDGGGEEFPVFLTLKFLSQILELFIFFFIIVPISFRIFACGVHSILILARAWQRSF